MQIPVLIGLVALLWNCPVARAQTDDATFRAWNLEALPPRLDAKVRQQHAVFARAGLTGLERGVYSSIKLWPPSQPVIRVCFMDSPQQTRRRIARYANQWAEVATWLQFDFGDLNDPRSCDPQDSATNHIRVGFDEGGYWSMVGQDSIHLVPQEEKSMNLSGFDTNPPDQVEFRRVVLHEFGHALGLQHEHQNPLSDCESEFDWDRLYRYFEGPPNHWKKEIVDFNMRKIHEPGLTAEPFDRSSIMLYTFSPEYFFKAEASPCFAPSNSRLSAGDRRIMKAMYPRDAAVASSQYQTTRDIVLKTARPAQTDRASQETLETLRKYLPEVTE